MTTAIRNKYTITAEKPKWEETPDGFLRTKARVLKSSVLLYLAEELEGTEIPEGTPNVIPIAVEADEMFDADTLRTLEGCPIVTWEHNWLDPETIGEFGRGATAGAARKDDPYIEIDLLVTHPDAIADIKAEKIGEISAGYLSNISFEQGEMDGDIYLAKQKGIKFNHIAVIPYGTGRCGLDVKIINKQKQSTIEVPGGIKMNVRVRLRNTGKVINTDEDGAKAIAEEEGATTEAVQSAEGEATEKGKSLEETMSALEAKNGEVSALQQEVEELKGELTVYKDKLDQLLSGEAIEEAAEEMNVEQGDAEEILENCAAGCAKPEEQEKIKNSKFVDGKPGKLLRGESLHRAVLGACGVKTENMSASEVKGAFRAQAMILNSTGKKRVVTGAKVVNSTVVTHVENNGARTALQRLGFK